MPGEARFVKADVSKAAEVEALVETVVSTYGRLDYAVNNAGLGAFASTVECTEKVWDLLLKVNVKGTWLCMRSEIPRMLNHGGAIVNMSSITGIVGIAGMPAYVASKHAIVGLTKTAALEYAKTGIRINAVCPGSILTPMQDPVIQGNPEIEAQLGATHPIGRMGTAEEVAAAIQRTNQCETRRVGWPRVPQTVRLLYPTHWPLLRPADLRQGIRWLVTATGTPTDVVTLK